VITNKQLKIIAEIIGEADGWSFFMVNGGLMAKPSQMRL
jgi:hypothetical protein